MANASLTAYNKKLKIKSKYFNNYLSYEQSWVIELGCVLKLPSS